MKRLNIIILLLLLFILTFCNNHSKKQELPNDVIAMLDSAKSNKQELLKVINHYNKKPEDSLKLKSAYFLISNMYQQAYYKAKLVDTNKTKVDLERTKWTWINMLGPLVFLLIFGLINQFIRKRKYT